jgi:hypothetical protein
VAVALLAGCLTDPEPSDASSPAALPTPPPEPYGATCLNGLLFQFVDYATTDRFLPPGFHPRDPRDFLNTQVAFGMAGVVVLVVQCTSADGEAYEAASVDIFVESPGVPTVEKAFFDFYELERYADPAEFDGVLSTAGWPRLVGNVNFTREVEPLPSNMDVIVDVTDEAGSIMSFAGPVNAPVTVGTGIVRFWRDGPAGLAYYQYDVVLNAVVGPGYCTARSGTALAALSPNPLGLAPLICPPSEPVVATFPGLSINATARFLPGVHAE